MKRILLVLLITYNAVGVFAKGKNNSMVLENPDTLQIAPVVVDTLATAALEADSLQTDSVEMSAFNQVIEESSCVGFGHSLSVSL